MTSFSKALKTTKERVCIAMLLIFELKPSKITIA